MKKIVTYEIYGQVERCSYIRVGKALFRIDFTGGSVNSAGVVPATFTTDNVLFQKAIEECEAFRTGQIKRGRVEEVVDKENISEDIVSTEEKNSENVFTDVTNMQQARAKLMDAPFNYSLSELQTRSAIKSAAEAKGVSFPNWI